MAKTQEETSLWCYSHNFLLKYFSVLTLLGIFKIREREREGTSIRTPICMRMQYYEFTHYVLPDRTQQTHVLQHWTPQFSIQQEVSHYYHQNSLHLHFS